eukprot:CAMPEP_0178653632 /NCGR_PEP_ID=MMETSP0698-20121128/23300_1 /TAXON_ID=265572 /ORGANISM="Extubocellulus spinifer, Strain CCMP396" /LENGTH=667 /DNA_ID=CAMNT_0020295445 /DNA_START=452 /DNA_END=2452 /DNA_ORIENTATION=+
MSSLDYQLIRAADCGRVNEVRSLLRRGVPVNAVDNNGETPLHWASWNGHSKVATMLLDSGANANAVNGHDNTPLHFASWNGHSKVAKTLLAEGANVNAVGKSGRTPLHCASWEGRDKVAKMLLGEGADINATNNDGKTPLDLARSKSQQAVVTLLEDVLAGRIVPAGNERKGRFIEVLNNVLTSVEATDEGRPFIDENGKTVTLMDLMRRPIELMDDFFQLKMIYTSVNAYHRVGVMKDGGRSALLISALERAKYFCKDGYHHAIYGTALDYSVEKGIIDDFKRKELSSDATVVRVMTSDGIKYMLKMIQANTRAILQLKEEANDLRWATYKAVGELREDVALVNDSLNTLREGMLYKQKVKAVGSLVSAVLNAFSFGAAGSAIQGVMGLTLARIVDFGDPANIKNALQSVTQFDMASLASEAEKITLHDTLQKCTELGVGALEDRKLDEALEEKNTVVVVAAAVEQFDMASLTSEAEKIMLHDTLQKCFEIGANALEDGNLDEALEKKNTVVVVAAAAAVFSSVENDAPSENKDPSATSPCEPSASTFAGLLGKESSTSEAAKSGAGAASSDTKTRGIADDDLLHTDDWEDILFALEDVCLNGDADQKKAYTYIIREGKGYEGGRDHFLALVKRSLKLRLKAKENKGTDGDVAAAEFLVSRFALLT